MGHSPETSSCECEPADSGEPPALAPASPAGLPASRRAHPTGARAADGHAALSVVLLAPGGAGAGRGRQPMAGVLRGARGAAGCARGALGCALHSERTGAPVAARAPALLRVRSGCPRRAAARIRLGLRRPLGAALPDPGLCARGPCAGHPWGSPGGPRARKDQVPAPGPLPAARPAVRALVPREPGGPWSAHRPTGR